jgi:lipopolysaccharide transport system permease protein
MASASTQDGILDAEVVVDSRGSSHGYGAEVWVFRELLAFLAWRDVLLRYKQTFFGVAWVLARPILGTTAFVFLFRRVADLPSPGLPYPLMVAIGMVAWQFCSSAISDCADSVVQGGSLIGKIYFPRIIMPTAALLANLVDLAVGGVLIGAVMLVYGVAPHGTALLVPFWLLWLLLLCWGAGLWLAALTVKYRDFRYVVPFTMQLGLYVSPVGFSGHLIPTQYRLVYAVNPMVGVIEGLRWSLAPADYPLEPAQIAIGLAVTVVLALSGAWYFVRNERVFADTI